jgi:exonuclease SbcD
MDPLRVLHTGDDHFANRPDLLADTVKCADYLVGRAKELKPDLNVISGDIFDEAVILGSPAAQAAIAFVEQLANIAPTIMVEGTNTHDTPDSLTVFRKLRTSHSIHVAAAVSLVGLDRTGNFRPVTEENLSEFTVIIGCLPAVTKQGLLATQDMSIAESDLEMAELIRCVFQGWGVINTQARKMGIPTLISAHGTVTGATMSTGQTIIGKGIEFGLGDLELAHADVALLAHIHKAQGWELPVKAFYCGNITRKDHAETEAKGFFFHEVAPGNVISRFIKTPARVMKTIKPEEGALPTPELLEEIKEGDVIRIVYRINQEDATKVSDAELKRIALEKGAADVKIDRQIIPLVRSRAAGISQVDSYEDKLKAWAATVDKDVSHLSGKLDKLLNMAAEEIIAEYREKEEQDEPTLPEAQGF